IVTTRLLVVVQDMGRSVSGSPAGLRGVAVRVTLWPRLRFNALLNGTPLSCTVETGGRMTGPLPPGVYCTTPPSKVCRWSPLESTNSCEVGSPRLPDGPRELTYRP